MPNRAFYNLIYLLPNGAGYLFTLYIFRTIYKVFFSPFAQRRALTEPDCLQV